MLSSQLLKTFIESDPFRQTLLSLNKLFQEHQIDQTHGFVHAQKVMSTAYKALVSYISQTETSPKDFHDKISPARQQSRPIDMAYMKNVMFAALLHDTDDRKYFPKNKSYENAESISREYFILTKDPSAQEHIAHIKAMISKVSYSTNGDKVDYGEHQLFLYPRYADRVEAIGGKGLLRCYLYNSMKGSAMFTQETPVPETAGQMLQMAEGRDLEYIKRGGRSASFIDHIFDKLVHLQLPELITNSYLRGCYQNGKDEIIQFTLKCAKSNYANTELEIKEYRKDIEQKEKKGDN